MITAPRNAPARWPITARRPSERIASRSPHGCSRCFAKCARPPTFQLRPNRPCSAAATLSHAPICAIGVDVGGTKIAAGLVSFPKGGVGARRQIPTAPARGGDAVFADVLRLCEELTTVAQGQYQRVNGIGVGVC